MEGRRQRVLTDTGAGLQLHFGRRYCVSFGFRFKVTTNKRPKIKQQPRVKVWDAQALPPSYNI